MALVAIYPLKSATQLSGALFLFLLSEICLLTLKALTLFFTCSYACTYVSISDKAEAWMDTCVHITLLIM